MTVLMVFATIWGVLQLAVLGSFARSTRVGTLMLAVITGCYGCGALTIIGEVGYTRVVAATTGNTLSEVVETASYTVDPFIEEIVKILPLVLVAVLFFRHRAQWGLTDFLLVGAGIGAGFSLAEAMLRFSSDASRAMSDGSGGFLLPSLVPPHIRGLGALLTEWLPPPIAQSGFLGLGDGPAVNYHLVWTALAGLGIGVVVRMHSWRRLLGFLPLLYAGVDHAANNYEISQMPDGFIGSLLEVLTAIRGVLPVIILLALISAGVIDVIVIRKVSRAQPELLLEAERAGRPAPLVLGRFAAVSLPWTFVVATRFALARRSVWYALADRPERPELFAPVAEIADRIDRAGDRAAWQRAIEDAGLGFPALRTVFGNWRVIIWLALLVPAIIYFVLGGVPLTAGLQDLMETEAVTAVVAVLAGLAVLYGIWQLILLIKRLPEQTKQAWAEGVLRHSLRTLVGACVVGLSIAAIGRWLTAGYSDRAIDNYHLLDALGSALMLAAMLMLLVGVFMMFPPGGLALAGIGGAAVTSGGLVIGGLTAAQVITIAGVLGLSGVLLMNSSQYGGGTSNEDGFEGTGFERDELAQLVHQHIGAGDLAGRPTLQKIIEALSKGSRQKLPGQNAVKFEYDGVRVIINRSNPFRSTAYYTGGG